MSQLKITATPENEDFYGKYESGKVGLKLLDNYFKAVEVLTNTATVRRSLKKALEIGCGPGFSTQRINKMLGYKTKLDASEYVEHLVKDAQKNNPDIKIWQEDIYKLKSKDDSYDLVYLLEVLEHLDYPDKALAEIKRVLKPGGLLIVGVPREPIWRVLNMARGAYWKSLGNTTGHLNHWSAGSLQRYLKQNFGPVIKRKKPLPWTLVLCQKAKV